MDIVNADFSDDAAVDKILDTWEEHKPDARHSKHGTKGFGDVSTEDQDGVSGGLKKNLLGEIKIMFFRCWLLIIRDPILYIGRLVAFLFVNMFFAFVYWNARPFVQERTVDKMWVRAEVSMKYFCLVSSVEFWPNPHFILRSTCGSVLSPPTVSANISCQLLPSFLRCFYLLVCCSTVSLANFYQ